MSLPKFGSQTAALASNSRNEPNVTHIKCRDTTKPYLRSDIHRVPVSTEQVSWGVKFPDYSPPDYTANSINGKPWADSEDLGNCKFNEHNDGGVNRKSFCGRYSLDSGGRPFNPFGRTGLRGRGVLGKWGPNHAADAIVSRVLDSANEEEVLQFVAIKRRDTGELAIPGGMIDRGESAFEAAAREFTEEALAASIPSEELRELWKTGVQLFAGYVDDPRNTDNAWMETSCFNFHDSTGMLLREVKLKAGSDADAVQWVSVINGLQMYASHAKLVKLFAQMHGININ